MKSKMGFTEDMEMECLFGDEESLVPIHEDYKKRHGN